MFSFFLSASSSSQALSTKSSKTRLSRGCSRGCCPGSKSGVWRSVWKCGSISWIKLKWESRQRCLPRAPNSHVVIGKVGVCVVEVVKPFTAISWLTLNDFFFLAFSRDNNKFFVNIHHRPCSDRRNCCTLWLQGLWLYLIILGWT